VRAARQEWQASQPALDATKLVFLDETSASTTMTRARGRAPKGERCVAAVPQGHWQTTTLVAGLRVNQITAPRVMDGPMDGVAFGVDVRQCLCPTLNPGDIVSADNLSSHKVKGVQQAIEARGATLRLLPSYSPDLNPIEQLFAKLKALLKKAAHRTMDALWQEIGKLLATVSPAECANYFKAAGYHV
jgi:transposase